MTHAQEAIYKKHTIRLEPHQERCSEYAFVILDPQGKEIKRVTNGGDTAKTAIANAQRMIDFEDAYRRQA